MRDQFHYLQSKDLGFNKEQLLVMQLNIPAPPGSKFSERLKNGFDKLEQFKIQVSQVPGVLSVFGAAQDMGHGNWINIGYTDDQNAYRQFNLNVVDEGYITGMKMEIVSGRGFSAEVSSDRRRAIIINEAFAKEYGWKHPIGQHIPSARFGDHEVIGVVKDFNYNSLHTKIEPAMLVTDLEVIRTGIVNINTSTSTVPKLMARLRPGNMAETIEKIRSVWSKLTAGEEFNFTFADQAVEAQYRTDRNVGKIISIATVLAILIASLGLYALASLAMQNRTKEISIRKIMGASEQSLMLLLSKDYVYLIVVSLFVSIPVTLYAMTRWMQAFEYRAGIAWQVFAIAGAVSLLVAFIATSYQAVKTARVQPAKTLKEQ